MTASALTPEVRPRIAQVIRLLGSDRDGEVLAAVRALRRTLAAAGLDLHDLAADVERLPGGSLRVQRSTPSAAHGWSWGTAGRVAVLDFLKQNSGTKALTEWEDKFLSSIIGKIRDPGKDLSERQAETLNQIMAKIAGVQS